MCFISSLYTSGIHFTVQTYKYKEVHASVHQCFCAKWQAYLQGFVTQDGLNNTAGDFHIKSRLMRKTVQQGTS
jgi:hypothetical protein